MNTDWMSDARKIPDDTMSYIRKIAVHAIVDRNFSPELIADVFNMSRTAIYKWIRWHNEGGDDALDTRHAPGAQPVITPGIDQWLEKTILYLTPTNYGYDTELWTLKILVALLDKTFGVKVYESTLANHLHDLGLSCQKPIYRSYDYDPQEVENYLTKKYPLIQRVAEKMGADIAFEDEAGIGIMTRSGRTWGAVNSPPIVLASDKRGGFNALSAIIPNGTLYYAIRDERINSDLYIEFLEMILNRRLRPLVLVADNASFHRSKKVRDFVCAHRRQIRMFFLPKHAPALNPDEQVWNEIKHRKLGREPVRSKNDLKGRLISHFEKLKDNAARIVSFFCLKDTRYILESNAA
jgi:transposase